MIGITGVSGSGKSTLINETLYPILNKYFFNGVKEPLPYGKITGLEHIDKVIDINQTPLVELQEVILLHIRVFLVRLGVCLQNP
ncbi:MAG: hypothetical protein CM15mP59_5770 [Flavobacteriaceae bacterium]|nr:MAG: hypothetical protein CM15mP59_5770 [Flavobacteriaceae bacterium]